MDNKTALICTSALVRMLGVVAVGLSKSPEIVGTQNKITDSVLDVLQRRYDQEGEPRI
jgi:hypothetical protein